MPNGTEDKALVASSEFDPSAFVAGIDEMTAALTKLSEQETLIKRQLDENTKALNANKAAMKSNQDQLANLDKNSQTYQADLQRLNAEQTTLRNEQKALNENLKIQRSELKNVNDTAKTYKDSLAQITAVARQLKQQGGSLFDVGALNQQVQAITEMSGRLREIFDGKIDTSELDVLEGKLGEAKNEFEELATVIDFIKEKMATLDPNTQEFQELNEVVETGTQILEAYGQTQEENTKKSQTLSQRLRAVQNEMAQLIERGETGTERFQQLQHEAAELSEVLQRTRERVAVFGNEFRLLEAGIEALRGIAAGFELAAGTATLFGVSQEQAEESIKRLTAIMAVLNGLQEISNLLKKDSVVQLVGERIATQALAISQRVLAVTLGTTAAASRGLAIALAATGIGALVVAIGVIISLLSDWANETKEMTEAQENLNIALEEGNKTNEAFLAGLEERGRARILEAEIAQAAAERIQQTDQQALERRITNNRQLREIEIRNLEEQIAQARRFTDSRRADFDAADAQLRAIAGDMEKAKTDIVKEFKEIDESIQISEESLNRAAAKRVGYNEDLVAALKKTLDEFEKADTTAANLEAALDRRRLEDQRDRLRENIELQRARLKAEEDFLKRLEDLRKRLLDAQNAAARQDAAQLRKTAQDNLNFELRAIDREVRQGKITRDQGNLLKNLLRQINEVELTDELKEFRQKVVDTQRQIEGEIFDLRVQNATERANLLRDSLEREAATIQSESEQQFENLRRQRDAQLRGVQDAFDKGLISESVAQDNADKVEQIYRQLFLNLAEQTRRRQEDLANLTFERSLQLVRDLFQPSFTNLTEAATRELEELSQRFVSNRITFERYQRELTEITRRETQRRIQLQITENEQLLIGVQERLKLENDPARKAELNREILRLREQIAQLRRQLADSEAQEERAQDTLVAEKVQRIATYVEAIGGLVNQVVAFWQSANDAEQRALERSIQLQETRVEAAVRIAERGNAEYLRIEEDRLNELRIKQENAARRQLAINAILQTSQALVAFTSALAQGISTGGPLGGIAIATAVLGLLASGYAIVQSLQQNSNVQQFKRGTKFVQRKNGEPSGDDTVPAMLTEGEGVVPRDQNRRYGPAVGAIIDQSIPAEDMNAFVNSYHANRRRFPQLAGDRIADATETHASYDARLAEISLEQTYLMRQTNERLDTLDSTIKNIGVSMNIDRHGIVAMVLQGLNRAKIDSKA